MEEKTIVFYDGSCGFCNKSVQFILSHRKDNSLLFIPLQSSIATKMLEDKSISIDMSTLYVFRNESIKQKSSAILSLIRKLKWYWFWLHLGYLLPKFVRDKAYDAVAKRRLKITGSFCYLPSKEERKMFKVD